MNYQREWMELEGDRATAIFGLATAEGRSASLIRMEWMSYDSDINKARASLASDRGFDVSQRRNGNRHSMVILIRCPPRIEEYCLTLDVIGLARAMVADEDKSRLPILADALQDVGYNNVRLLRKLYAGKADLSFCRYLIWRNDNALG